VRGWACRPGFTPRCVHLRAHILAAKWVHFFPVFFLKKKASQHRFWKKKGSHWSGARGLPGQAKTGQNPRVKKKRAQSFATLLFEGAKGLTLVRTFLPSTRPRETNENTRSFKRAPQGIRHFLFGGSFLGTWAGSVRKGFRGCGETDFFLLCVLFALPPCFGSFVERVLLSGEAASRWLFSVVRHF
jgi:hypothetical protein